ncbi:hypothetical protein L218DRAFT_965167, partial [Marasmius fiardii PR-910]
TARIPSKQQKFSMAPSTRSTARRGNPARDDVTSAPAASGPTTPFQVPGEFPFLSGNANDPPPRYTLGVTDPLSLPTTRGDMDNVTQASIAVSRIPDSPSAGRESGV